MSSLRDRIAVTVLAKDTEQSSSWREINGKEQGSLQRELCPLTDTALVPAPARTRSDALDKSAEPD